MPYYHVKIKYKTPGQIYESTVYELNLTEEDAKLFGEQYEKGLVFFNGEWIDTLHIKEIEIRETLNHSASYFSSLTSSTIFYGGRTDIKNVTRKFIKSPPKKAKIATKVSDVPSKNVFIVHGRDHKPMKELKVMLSELGFNPIVLHEQPSGGMTLAEKLENYSDDVGYAFVILTPDDVGCQKTEAEKFEFKPRARQNVIFEMGYFWGLLERKRVCCLLKGNVEKPSDIEGIVYILFKDSLNENRVRSTIIKELQAVGYEIKR